MPCGSCGQKSALAKAFKSAQPASSARPAQAAAPLRDQANMITVVYMGQTTNHYIPSPTRKVRHYGYGKRGMVVPVHRDDVLRRPDMFVPQTIDEALKVWPQYPADTPLNVVEMLGQRELIVTLPETVSLPDITNMTIAEMKGMGELTVDQLKTLIGIEKANKNRSGALTFLEEKLGVF